MNFEIHDFTSHGRGVARDRNRMVWMIAGAVPGDVVEIDVNSIVELKNAASAEVKRIVIPSPHRKEHPCEHYRRGCMGSPLGVFDYEAGLKWKTNHLGENLKRLGGLKDINTAATTPAPRVWDYRDRIELQFRAEKGKIVSGFAAGGEIIPVRRCLLASKPIQNTQIKLADSLPDFAERFAEPLDARLLIRDNGRDSTVIIVFVKDMPLKESIGALDELCEKSAATGWQILKVNSFNNRLLHSQLLSLHGACGIEYSFALNRISLSPLAFTQTNKSMLDKLIGEALKTFNPDSFLLDLFGGFGVFGLSHAARGGTAVVMDSAKQALTCGATYAAQQNLNVKYIHQNLYSRNNDILSDYKNTAAILLDPPRQGLKENLIKALNKKAFSKIIYVSCHTAALARDLKQLKNYRVESIQPLDMFPNTAELETVAVLTR